MIRNCFNGIDASVAPGSVIERIVAFDNRSTGIAVAAGSIISQNITMSNGSIGASGIFVLCPSNVIGNTSTNNFGPNLTLAGPGCNSSNNVAP
jgi:hypothetical protein